MGGWLSPRRFDSLSGIVFLVEFVEGPTVRAHCMPGFDERTAWLGGCRRELNPAFGLLAELAIGIPGDDGMTDRARFRRECNGTVVLEVRIESRDFNRHRCPVAPGLAGSVQWGC